MLLQRLKVFFVSNVSRKIFILFSSILPLLSFFSLKHFLYCLGAYSQVLNFSSSEKFLYCLRAYWCYLDFFILQKAHFLLKNFCILCKNIDTLCFFVFQRDFIFHYFLMMQRENWVFEFKIVIRKLGNI